MRRVSGDAGDGQSQRARLRQVDVVEPRRSQRDEAYAAFMQPPEHVIAQAVVYECTYCGSTGGERSGRGCQTGFEILNVMTVSAVGFVEKLSIEPVGAEERDAHDLG